MDTFSQGINVSQFSESYGGGRSKFSRVSNRPRKGPDFDLDSQGISNRPRRGPDFAMDIQGATIRPERESDFELDIQDARNRPGRGPDHALDTQDANSRAEDGQTSVLESEINIETNFQDIQLVGDVGDERLNEARTVLERVINGAMSVEEALSQEVFSSINKTFDRCKTRLKQNKTPPLWFQYLRMVYILRKAIIAERIRDFPVHLEAVREMLPFLAATGHNHLQNQRGSTINR